MKLKDIEKNLKREQEGKSVPDVYTRVKKAPLNKLLTGETPARAFRKQLAVATLIFVLVLFFVAAIALTAMWLYRTDAKPEPDCYVRITVGDGGEQLRLGVLMRPEIETVCIVTEAENGEVGKHPLITHSSQITDLISPKQGDKISVQVLCENTTRGYYVARTLVNFLGAEYGEFSVEVSASCNDYFAKLEWVDYINVCGGDVKETNGVRELISAYVALFSI